MKHREDLPSRGLAATLVLGALAGVGAAVVTSLFQKGWTALELPPTDKPTPEPPTETLAVELYQPLSGQELRGVAKSIAGEVVHLVTGAGLGSAFALLTRKWPDAAAGKGVAYGLGVWLIVEEAGLAILDLKPSPTKVEPAEHVFAASSHVVFGLALDAMLTALAKRSGSGNQ